MKRLTEKEIKVICIEKLQRQRRIDSSAIISSEFPLKGTSTRVDIAILKKDFFIGIEIKSELDTLRRIENQIDVFSSHFDLLILVLAGRHTNIQIDLPKNVELWELKDSKITRHSAPQITKRSNELLPLISKREFKKSKDKLADGRARSIFFDEFRKRYEQPSKVFWEDFSSNSKNVSALQKLSPNYKFRLAQAKLNENKAETIKKWEKYYSDHSSSVS